MFGKIHGRFFLQQDLGISSDDTPSTFTLSELIETYPYWQKIVEELRNNYDTVNLCTMFETNDVHPDIIDKMKLFDEVLDQVIFLGLPLFSCIIYLILYFSSIM